MRLPGDYHDYRRVNQEGSHVILETETPRQHRVAVPDHKPLRVGTLSAVARVHGIRKEDVLRS